METNNPHQEFFDKVKYFVKTPIDDLIQNKLNPSKGVLIFNELKSGFTDFQSILGYITEDIILSLPEFKILELKQRLEPLFQTVDTIQKLQKIPTQPDTSQMYPIIQPFINPYNHSYPNETGFFLREKEPVWSIVIQALALYLHKNKSNQKISDIILNLQNTEKQASLKLDNLNRILTSAQLELSKSGVDVHSDIFLKQADKHFINSKEWRKYSIWSLISTIFISLTFFSIIAFAIDDSRKIIETGVLAALIISLFTYSSTLAVKNYFAEKHNESINRHKANCLSTFNTFIDSADNERKAAVLLQATQTIFSHQSSGFLSKEIDINNPNPIVEIVRNVTSKSGSLN